MDLIPGLGDLLGAVLSLYLIWIAFQIELPKNQIWLMIKNIIADFLLGILPVFGPIADIFYKSNKLNVEIMERFYQNVFEGEIV